MNKKVKQFIINILIVSIAAVLIGFFVSSQNQTYEKSMKKRGEEVVYEIEVFKATHGFFPKNLNELFTNNKQVCEVFTLQLIDNENYELSFKLRGNKKMSYQSKTRTWIKKTDN